MTFLAHCASCLLVLHDPAVRCPECKSPRLVLVTGAFPVSRVAAIPLVVRAKDPAKESDEAYLARRVAESAKKEAARRARAFLRLVAQHAKLESRVFALDVGRRHREAVTREQRRARREQAKAERRDMAAAEREKVAESKRLAIEERRRSAHEKWARERREMAVRAQVRLEVKTFREDRPSVRVQRARSAARSAARGAVIEARPETLFGGLIDRFGEQFPDFMARDGHRLAAPLPEFTAWLAAGGGL